MGEALSSTLAYQALGHTPVQIALDECQKWPLIMGIRAGISTALTMDGLRRNVVSKRPSQSKSSTNVDLIDHIKSTNHFSDLIQLYVFLQVQCIIHGEDINTHLERIFQKESLNPEIGPIVQQLLNDPLFLQEIRKQDINKNVFCVTNPEDTLDACLA